MISPRIVLPLLLAMIVLGVVRAQAEDPPEAEAARHDEHYAIQPGAEPLLGEMLGRGETLPGGCTLSGGKIERTAILATYTCGDARIVLRLLHPAAAPSEAVRTERMAVTIESGTPPAGLVDAVADRIRAREAAFEWTKVGDPGAPTRRWPVPVAAGAVVVMLAFWALRRRAAHHERSG